MRFEICTADISSNKPYEILKKYPCLKAYGFEVEETLEPVYTRIRDERGRFIRQIDYKTKRTAYITIVKLEHIPEFMKVIGNPIVITDNEPGLEITIYDGYLE